MAKTASVKFELDWYLPALRDNAGGIYHYVRGDHVFVEGCTQGDLNKAAKDFDAAYEQGRADALVALEASDKVMARMVEDIIDSVVAKGLMTMTEFPPTVEEKINHRKAQREKL